MSDISNGVIVIVNQTDATLHDADGQLMQYMFKTGESRPFANRAIHYIRPPLFRKLVDPVMREMMGKELRCRSVYHRGLNFDVVDSLGEYGIPPRCIPMEVGGDLTVDVVGWLERRKSMGL